MDEKTPHIHCVVIPLVKKYDKRTNTERYTISKKQYIKDKVQLSELQDKYHKRLIENGYDLERGIKVSDRKHIKIKEYKKINRELEQKINVRSNILIKEFNELDEKIKLSKNIPFDKKHIIIDKDIFDIMNRVIIESKKITELEPKIMQVFNEIDEYSNSFKSLEKENQNIRNEVTRIKTFFRNLLLKGSKDTKDLAVSEIKDYYDYNDFEF